jgi:murein DD-endopeptidase MepM/ murein hydrolase activator NlpD
MRRSEGIAVTVLGLATALAIGASAPAIAEGAAAAAAEDAEAPVRITISKVPEGEGRPVYADREAFSGSGMVVGFSRTRPRRVVSAAPAGAAPMQSTRSATAQYVAPSGPRVMPAYFPLAARAMTSGFGPRPHPILGGTRAHSGVDLAAPAGTPISATADGVVTFANWNGGYGIMVAVSHAGGVETRYGHMMRLAVAPGQQVRAGDVVGWVGSTGLSTGPHVHYEVRVDGRAVSPWSRGGR